MKGKLQEEQGEHEGKTAGTKLNMDHDKLANKQGNTQLYRHEERRLKRRR